jgi:glycopeptide antibiotics resistance protein
MLTIHELYEDIKIGVGVYSSHLLSSVPKYVCEGLFSILCLVAVALIFKKGKSAFRYIARLILAEYLILLYCATLFFRTTKEHPEFDYTLFWSYEHSGLEVQSVMNVLVFIPVGLLVVCSWKNISWWKSILLGCVLSVGIELLQLIMKRGFSELDDVMHNTLGCIIGFGLYFLIRFGYEKVSKRSVAVL